MSENNKKLKFIAEDIAAYITTNDNLKETLTLNVVDVLSLAEEDIKKLEITKEQYKNGIEMLKNIAGGYGSLLKIYNIYLQDGKNIITSGDFTFVHEKVEILKNFSKFKFIKIKNIFSNIEIEKTIIATSDEKTINVHLLELGYYLLIGNNEEENIDKEILKHTGSKSSTSFTEKRTFVAPKNISSNKKPSAPNNTKPKNKTPEIYNKKIQNFNRTTTNVTTKNSLIAENVNINGTKQGSGRVNVNKKSNSPTENAITPNTFATKTKINSVNIKTSVTSDTQTPEAAPIKIDTKTSEKSKADKKNTEKEKRKFSIKINPTVLAFVIILVLLIGVYFFFLSILFIGSIDEDSGLNGYNYVDPMYDYSKTIVDVTNDYINISERKVYEALLISDFLKGAAYIEFYDLLGTGINDQQLMNMYNAYMVIEKARAFSIGKYNFETKEIFIKSSDSEIPYCDIYNGCKKIDNNGRITYVSNLYAEGEPGIVIASYPPASEVVSNALTLSYEKTIYELLTPNTLKEEFTSYEKFTIPSYDSSIRQTIIDEGLKNTSYKSIITNISQYSDYKVYDLKEYAWVYSLAGNKEWWWPIGSQEPSASGLYSGPPMSTHISSPFGMRTLNYNGETGMHNGIDLSGKSGVGVNENIIIASRSGTVVTVLNTCKDNKGTNYSAGQCGSGNGNFVRIDHGDGYYSIYKHLNEGSIPLKEGDFVMQGQMVGRMGNSGRVIGRGHLHFGIMNGGWWSYVNPSDYVDPDNPRPNAGLNAQFTEGESNKATICSSLKASGFSDEATAAIIINIEKTSGYNPQAKSANDVLYGLFGYTSSQLNKLKGSCGSEYTSLKCQLEYFVNDVNNNYLEIKSDLQSSSSYNDKIYNLCYNYLILANKHNECNSRANVNIETILTYVKNGCK